MKDLSSDESTQSTGESSEESETQSTNETYDKAKTRAEKSTAKKTTRNEDQSESYDEPTDTETDTESELETVIEPEAANKNITSKTVDQITKCSGATKRAESDRELSPEHGDKPQQDNSDVFSMSSRVRQVSLYDSSDEESDCYLDTESSPSSQSNKENLPDNIPVQVSTGHNKIPLVQPKSHIQQAQLGMDTSKKLRCLELHQEIGNLLEDDDSKHNLMQQTALEVSKLLKEDISPPQVLQLPDNHCNNPFPVFSKSAVNSTKTTLHSMPVKVSPKGAITKNQTTNNTKSTSNKSSTAKPINQKSLPCSRVPSIGSKSGSVSSKAPSSVASKATTTKPNPSASLKSPPLPSQHSEKSPPIPSRLSIQPKPRASLLSSSNKPLPPSSKSTLRVPLAPRKSAAGQTNN